MRYSKSDYLMGTNIEITIFSDTNALEDIYSCFGIFYGLENEFSRFSSNSDLSLLNKNKKLEVSDRFINILKLAIKIYNQTDGFFNPLINLKNVGYINDFKKGNFTIDNTKQNLDINKIKIEGNTVILAKNQNLDLGGIVKGYGVDLVVSFLRNIGYNNFIINAGGDIYLSGNINGEKIVVGIDNPFDTKLIFATLELENLAISTSGIYKRKWDIDGKTFNHILNPKTNTNNNEIISISLISEKVYISDSYATACVSMGIKKSLIFLEKYNINGVIIGSDGNIYKTKGVDSFDFNLI